jgi:hypothetical protein
MTHFLPTAECQTLLPDLGLVSCGKEAEIPLERALIQDWKVVKGWSI